MSEGKREAEARPPVSRAVYLRLKIDADMGEVFQALIAVPPRKRSREATFYLRLGVERSVRLAAATAPQGVTVASLPSVTEPASPLREATVDRDHLAGLPGIDD